MITNVYCNAGGVRGKAALYVCAHRDSCDTSITTPKQYAIVRYSLYNLHGMTRVHLVGQLDLFGCELGPLTLCESAYIAFEAGDAN